MVKRPGEGTVQRFSYLNRRFSYGSRYRRPFCIYNTYKSPRIGGGFCIGGPSSVHPRPVKQSAGLFAYGLFKFFACGAMPRNRAHSVQRGAKTNATRWFRFIRPRKAAIFNGRILSLHNKKTSPVGDALLLVGHPLFTRALCNSPQDCCMRR